ncbi:MAG TPA: Gfo/Idh/MocA family oxidoreductase [Candidatus Hydrogenedentes bacterium]|nr:Gfo/Idh/MocA family oxidoreductase [Candidatus Hydrogenedentota bacterium]
MSTFRLGFIGAGFIAKFQARAMRQIRGVQLAGVTALKGAEELAAFADANGLGPCKVCASVAELCREVDAVAIFAPNMARVQLMQEIVDAVKNGAELKGIICEKPLGRTVAEANQIVELAKEAGLPTAYFENQCHMKGIRAQKEQLRRVEETMGPLVLARSAEEHSGPHEPWFWDPTRQGGGVLSDMGCHSIACGWYVLTPNGKPVDFLEPISVQATTSLLKWGLPKYRKELFERTRVDYSKTPAEDFATGMVTFKNPETGQLVQAQFTNSWMYDKQGLRLYMDGLGPGYAFELNSLRSPLEIFIGDQAAEAVIDAESALEKSTASRGLLVVEPNEADLYGYVDEIEDAVKAFQEGRDAFLNFEYGAMITLLVQAAYMSAEQGRTIYLTEKASQEALKSYKSLIAQGRGGEILF